MLSAEAMIGLAALVVMCLPALGYVLRVYSRRRSSSNSQVDVPDVEKADEGRDEFKLSRPSTCNSCLMQFESSTYFHELPA
ncbi:hypothetical protein GLAREA_10697 [Glarea lozoyensis ATCC 20868]|uniref:Uncharacterized protein n=1 Tax=Glarea lozoyensis (strain ATCC 20868 / MF5171) TaxID=1116229 RepID=S3D949_GLAL2|nr:uncharacterized protein GLAREA_10697 [Glarea lozoyensis ATCC 20868]EPE35002.1 hypothetical protein GLAREA_10697 [Glarea lozoyensis ATCC 20868]